MVHGSFANSVDLWVKCLNAISTIALLWTFVKFSFFLYEFVDIVTTMTKF